MSETLGIHVRRMHPSCKLCLVARSFNQSVKFVWIDANPHQVGQDLRDWWKFVESGGFIGGADYNDQVEEFVRENRLVLNRIENYYLILKH